MDNILKNYLGKSKKRSLNTALSKVYLFSELSSRALKEISRISYIRDFEDGEVIFRKDEPSFGMFIVLNGEVELIGTTKGNKTKSIGRFREYESFGELSLTKDNIRRWTAVAKNNTKLCYIPKYDLMEVFLKNPQISVSYYEKIIEALIDNIESCEKPSR